jgi:DNA (cytosine-5)-methyltransferase 1
MSRPPTLRLHLDRDELVVDAFAGGGGASTGIELATGRSPDIAINHDADALAMHARNHPRTVHFVADVFAVDPREACGKRAVGLLWASPDCTYFSKARGSKPHRDRKAARRRRGLAGVVTRWAAAVRPRVIIMENVEEFRTWGPLLADGRPDPKRRGQSFDRWIARLRNMGYAVEWRELRACDFGAPTTRKRLFIVARCDGAPIVWPAPTHGPRAEPHRAAAECIDWSIPMKSIFGRKKPLAEATQRRIAAGLRKFVLTPGKAKPFYVHTGNGERVGQAPRVRDLDEPLGTVTAKGSQGMIAAPVLAHAPTATACTRRGAVPHDHRSAPRRDRVAGVAQARLRSVGSAIDEPARTTTCDGGGHHALVTAFLARHFGGVATSGSGVDEPLRTITTTDHHALVAAQLALFDDTTEDRGEECEAFLVKYFGNEREAHSLQLPLATVTTKDRFGLVVIDRVAYRIVDIRMRMLTPRELFLAQGFPRTYVIEFGAGGRKLPKGAQIEKCGNSVSPPNAAALVRANLSEPARRRSAPPARTRRAA